MAGADTEGGAGWPVQTQAQMADEAPRSSICRSSFRTTPRSLEEQQRRAADLQLRIADKITAFAGSMNFVYLHIVLFAV